ncbi:MAG: phosphatase PAP2 family protein [Chitinivibrionales bacterium]|nr:phosphatase PAP2 family protein [Chitinivibrionales bacterium]
MATFFFSIDCAIFFFINKTCSNPVFDAVFTYITNGSNWTIPLIIISAVFLVKKRSHALIVLCLAGITIGFTDPVCFRIIKPLVHRLRPCNPSYFIDGHHLFLPGAHFLIGLRESLSFPSNHAANYFGQAMLLTLFYPSRWPWFFIPAFFVALSRVYVGVHYPSDIAVGSLVGVLCGWLVYFGYLKIVRSWRSRKKRRGGGSETDKSPATINNQSK